MTLALLFTPRANLGDPDGWIKYYKAKWDAHRKREDKPDPHRKKKKKLKAKKVDDNKTPLVEVQKWLDSEFKIAAKELTKLEQLEKSIQLLERQKELDELYLRRKALLLEMLRIERMRDEEYILMMLLAAD